MRALLSSPRTAIVVAIVAVLGLEACNRGDPLERQLADALQREQKLRTKIESIKTRQEYYAQRLVTYEAVLEKAQQRREQILQRIARRTPKPTQSEKP